MNMNTMEQAQEAGFATFNNQPHLCIDIPDGSHTITVRTSEGKKVTFAFQSYTEGGAPQCVDIVRENMRTFDWENGQRKAALPSMITVLMDEED